MSQPTPIHQHFRRLVARGALVALLAAAAFAGPLEPTVSPNLLCFGDFEYAWANASDPDPWQTEGQNPPSGELLQLFAGADAAYPERGNVLYVDYAPGNAGVRQDLIPISVTANTTYRASFDYRAPDLLLPGSEIGPICFSAFQFQPGGGAIFTSGPYVTPAPNWATYEFEFTTPPQLTELGFTIISGTSGGDPNFPETQNGISFELDNLSLVQVGTPPQPGILPLNNGFESLDPNGLPTVEPWEIEGVESAVLSLSSDAHRGDNALRIDFSAPFKGVRQGISVADNDTIQRFGRYRLEFYYKAAADESDLPVSFRAGLWEFAPTTSVLHTSLGIQASADWQFGSFEAQLVDPNINFLRVVFQGYEDAGSFLVDDVRVIPVDSPNGLIRNPEFDLVDAYGSSIDTLTDWLLTSPPAVLSFKAVSEGNNNFLRINANGNGGVKQEFTVGQGAEPDTLYRASMWYRAADPAHCEESNPDPIKMVAYDFGPGLGNTFYLIDNLDPNYSTEWTRLGEQWRRYPSLIFRTRAETALNGMGLLISSGRPDVSWDVDDVQLVKICDLADLDNDGDVDVADMAMFQDCFTAAVVDPNDANLVIPQTPEGFACHDADLDEDQDVDEDDLAMFWECFEGVGGYVYDELATYTFDDTTGTGAGVGAALNASGVAAGVSVSALGANADYVGALGAVPPDTSDGFGFANLNDPNNALDGEDVLYWRRAAQGLPSLWGTPSDASTGVDDAGMNFVVTADGADVTVEGILIEATGAAYINTVQVAGGQVGWAETAQNGVNFVPLFEPVLIPDGSSETFTVLWNSGAFGTLLNVNDISIRGTVTP